MWVKHGVPLPLATFLPLNAWPPWKAMAAKPRAWSSLGFQGVSSKFEVSTDAEVPELTVSPAAGDLELTGLSAKATLKFETSQVPTPNAPPRAFNVNCKVCCRSYHVRRACPSLAVVLLPWREYQLQFRPVPTWIAKADLSVFVTVQVYYCQQDDVCLYQAVSFKVPLGSESQTQTGPVELKYTVVPKSLPKVLFP